MKLGDAHKALVEVGGRAGYQRDRQTVVVKLIILDIFRCPNRLNVFLTGLLSPHTEISTSLINLVYVQESLQGAAEVNSEAAEEGLPEGVLLDALARQDAVLVLTERARHHIEAVDVSLLLRFIGECHFGV